MKTKKHSNIAIFIPHEGCPHMCSFCNQSTISGKTAAPTPKEVEKTIKLALGHGLNAQNSEIAFFGGSFTAIDRKYMTELLKTASFYCKKGFFKGIRISTRPDYIDDEVLHLLKRYNVTAIELGAQSMCDEVLMKNGRGHKASDTSTAALKIKDYGFSLGLQMMTGLPFDTNEGTIKTAEKLIALKPQTIRIYPTIVLKGTELEELYKSGKYVSQSLDEAVFLCAKLLMMFHKADIDVIRLGLHSSEELKNNMLSGPFHPAFRELCEGEIYYNLMCDIIKNENLKSPLMVEVSPFERSKMAGQKRKNIMRLKDKGIDIKIVDNDDLKKYEINVCEYTVKTEVN